MVDESKTGKPWGDDELDAIVADYFAMLALDAANRPFVKAHRARSLEAEIGRVHKSIEFKHMNISAVAAELGLPTVRGYRPMTNYQAAIFPAIDRYLSVHPEAWAIGDETLAAMEAHRPDARGLTEPTRPFFSPFMGEGDREAVEGANRAKAPLRITDAPVLTDAAPRPEGLRRLIRKFDPAARDARNRALGRVGERHAYEHEIAKLVAADRMDLAKQVEWTSQERGDGAGYDIRSYDPATSEERFIEVKTTRGGAKTDFFLSRNERAFSDEEPKRFRLYRLYDAAADTKMFALAPPLGDAVRLTPETWRAGF